MKVNATDKEEYDLSFLPVDPLLQYIVSVANETGIGIPLTLMVKGIMITGETIKVEKYFDRLIAIFGDKTNFINPTSEDSTQMIADHFTRVLKTFRNLSDESDRLEKIHRPILIHLENVQIIDIAADHRFEMKGGLWRGRIDSIDGFIFGNP
jgi:hypothetical protein